jgi:cytoskeletal protein CcmA (bactofilin family)
MFNRRKNDSAVADGGRDDASVSAVLKGAIASRVVDSERYSVLSEGLEIEGTLIAQGGLNVEGRITGTVQGAQIQIGAAGSLEGIVTCAQLTVKGRVEGTVTCDELQVAATGWVKGTIRYRTLMVTPGGRVEGELVTTTDTVATVVRVADRTAGRAAS